MSATSRSGETLHLFSTLHPISARQPMPSTTHLWLSLMTERASSVALDVDQLMMAWRRFNWLLTRCTTLVYWQMELLLHRIINSLLVDLVQPIRLVHSGYSAILLEPFDMAWWLLNIVLYCDLPSSLSHINTCTDIHTHTLQISSKSSTRTGEKRERIRNMGQRALQSILICYSASGTFISWCF